jgi:hypothetical protein
MNIQALKLDLIQWLLGADNEVLKKVEKIRKQTTSVREFKPMTIEELSARAEQSERDIREGRVKTFEQVKKEAEKW